MPTYPDWSRLMSYGLRGLGNNWLLMFQNKLVTRVVASFIIGSVDNCFISAYTLFWYERI